MKVRIRGAEKTKIPRKMIQKRLKILKLKRIIVVLCITNIASLVYIINNL